MRGWWWLVLLAAPGCTEERLSTVTSEVIEIPEIAHGFYYNPLQSFQNGDQQVRIYLSNVPDLCDRYADMERALMAQEPAWTAWQSLFPAEFWQIFVVIRVQDYWGDLEQAPLAVIEDLLVDELPSNRAFIELAHFQQPFDQPFFEGEAPLTDYAETWVAEGGTFQFDHWAPPRASQGSFSARLTNSVGFDVGTLDAQMDLPRCGSWEQVLRAVVFSF